MKVLPILHQNQGHSPKKPSELGMSREPPRAFTPSQPGIPQASGLWGHPEPFLPLLAGKNSRFVSPGWQPGQPERLGTPTCPLGAAQPRLFPAGKFSSGFPAGKSRCEILPEFVRKLFRSRFFFLGTSSLTPQRKSAGSEPGFVMHQEQRGAGRFAWKNHKIPAKNEKLGAD